MIKKNFLTGLEIENSYDCLQCTQPITNPICHSCLAEGIGKWLSFYPQVKRKVMPKIRKYVVEVNNSLSSSLSCVSCNKKKAALCPYCFTEGILNLLKKNSVDKNVLGDFLSTFNFDLKHEGYIQDAIEEGLY
jgi:hypothetical protein